MAKKVGSVYAEIRADIKKLQADFDKAHQVTQQSAKKIQTTLDNSIKFDNIAKSVVAAGVSIYAAFRTIDQVIDSAKIGATLEKQAAAFENLSNAAGTNSKKMVDSLKTLSNGLVSESDLMQSAGKAMLMSIPADKITQLMKIAAATSQMTGQTITDAFNDITMGVARQSRMILDNLGIIVNVEKANADYAKSLGKTASSLTEAEQRQAFMNAVLKSGADMMARLGESRQDVDGVNRLLAAMGNLTSETAKVVNRELNPAFSATAKIVEAITNGIKNMNQAVESMSSNAVEGNIKKIKAALENQDLGPQQRKYFEERLAQLEKRRGSLVGSAAESNRLMQKQSEQLKPQMSHFVQPDEAKRSFNYQPDSTIIDTSYLDKIDKLSKSESAAAAEAKRLAEEIAKLEQEFQDSKIFSGEGSNFERMEAQLRSGSEISQMVAERLETENQLYADAAERENAIMMEKVKQYEKTQKSILDLSQRTADAMEENFSNLFFDAMSGQLKTAEDYWRAFFTSIQRMASDLLAQQAREGLFGQGGLLSMLFGGKMSVGGVGGEMTASQSAAASLPVNTLPYQPFHGGGIVGETGGAYRSIPASYYSGAPRLHKGLMPNEYPAILEQGEAVIPKGKVGSQGMGGTTNVYNIQAMDVKSFVDYLRKSGGVPSIMGENVRANGAFRKTMKAKW